MTASVFANCNTSAMHIDFNCEVQIAHRHFCAATYSMHAFHKWSRCTARAAVKRFRKVNTEHERTFTSIFRSHVFGAHSAHAFVCIYLPFVAVTRINIIGCLVSCLISRDLFLFALFHFLCVKYANASLCFYFRSENKLNVIKSRCRSGIPDDLHVSAQKTKRRKNDIQKNVAIFAMPTNVEEIETEIAE